MPKEEPKNWKIALSLELKDRLERAASALKTKTGKYVKPQEFARLLIEQGLKKPVK